MVKLEEIRNEADVRACDLFEDDNGVLWYQIKWRDNRGKTKPVYIKVSDMIYPALKHMTSSERQRFLRLEAYNPI